MIKKRTIHFESHAQQDATQSIVIGRASKKEGHGSRLEQEGNLLLLDGTISKRHAIIDISTSQGKVLLNITDLGSQHGTVWKDKLLPSGASVSLKNGDYIGLVCLKKCQTPKDSVDSIDEWTYAPLDCCKFLFKIDVLHNSIVFQLVDVEKEFSQEAEATAISDSLEDQVTKDKPEYVHKTCEVFDERFSDNNGYDYEYQYVQEIDDELEVEELDVEELEVEELSAAEEFGYLREKYEEYPSQQEVPGVKEIYEEGFSGIDSVINAQSNTADITQLGEEETSFEEQKESDTESTFSRKKRSFNEFDDLPEQNTSISSWESELEVDYPSTKKLKLILVSEDNIKSTIKSKLYAGCIGALLGSALTFGTLASIGRSLNESL